MISATLQVLSPGDHHALQETHFTTQTELLHALAQLVRRFEWDERADLLVLHVCVEAGERPPAAVDRHDVRAQTRGAPDAR